jgi:hypothetical protein
VKTIKLSEASQALAEYVAGRRDEVVVLTERNKPGSKIAHAVGAGEISSMR